MKRKIKQSIFGLHLKRRDFLIFIFCLVCASIFVFLFSFSTSPLFGEYYGGMYSKDVDFSGDSAQFQLIGEEWLKGKVPYRDIFDHKGPVIFLINTLGYLIYWRTGIMLIQVICLTITLFYIFRICSLVSSRFTYGAIAALLSLIFLSRSYADGNSVQEYALPFLSASTYYIVKFLIGPQHKKEHSPKRAVLYGVSAAFCLLSQATSAIVIGAGVLVIGAYLTYHKQWKNLLNNILFGCVGFIGLLLPFLVYFAINGCVGDFIYATLIFNMEYAKNIGSWVRGATGEQWQAFFQTYFPFISIFITVVLSAVRKKYPYSLFLLICGLLEGYLFFSAQSFSQYATITLIQLSLLLNELFLLIKTRNTESIVFGYVLASVVLIMAYNQSMAILQYVPDRRSAVLAAEQVGYEDLLERNLDKIREGTFSAFGEKEFKDLYLKYRLSPNNKYFVIQTWHSSFSEKVENEVRASFDSNNTTYLLLDAAGKHQTPGSINNILDKKYTMIDKEGEFELYKIK